jgi:uncharacterized protein
MTQKTGRAALLLAALLMLLGNGQASAATQLPTATATAGCADEIVDGAGVLSPADVTMLTQGSAALAATTTLRLRTVTSVPKKDLNAYEKTLQISCGWANAANVRQPKLLVVMVDTQDRQMGIYPGPALSGTIDKPIWLSIEQHNMRPHLASADWEGGLQGGVYALAALINGGALVASSPPVATAASGTHKSEVGQVVLWGGVMGLWAVVGLVGRARRRRRWKQSSAYLYDNIPYGGGHHHGGWGGGGGSDGGGGGSSSDGGGGSSGF